MSDDWDVDSYKSEFENEEHWQLRRNFMLAHKDKFPEDELVCLAQAFTNIEFMGCRYPDKTMIRIAELAKGVVEKFREKRKNSLKRTFVAASDAASAKVKGRTTKGEESASPNKILKTEMTDKVKEIKKESNPVEIFNSRVSKYGGVKTFNIKQKEPIKCYQESPSFDTDETDEFSESSNDPLRNFVLILDGSDDHPVAIMQRSSDLNKCFIKWDYEERGGSFHCKLFLNDQCIATSSGGSMKMSKEYTAMVAIAKLRETCYGIRIKSKFYSDTTITPALLQSSASEPPPTDLGEDNVGRKLMKLMGWQGGGLGSREQGNENPVSVSIKVNKAGLGLSSSNIAEFKKKVRDYIINWLDSNSNQDLVFSSEFNNEERKSMHLIAKSFSLKSKSRGKSSNRQLVISKKCDPWEIVNELRRTGGSSEKYELLLPTKT